MADAWFVVASLLGLAGSVVYGYVGWRLSRRRVEGPSRLASGLFSVWWAAIAATTGIGALVRLGVVAGVVDLPLYLTWTYLSLLFLVLALWALLYYLVYLLTGSRRAFGPITAGYAALFVYYVYLVTAARPRGLSVEGSRVVLDYAEPIQGVALLVALVAMLGPHLVAAAGYFRLFFKVEGATQRYRIGLVSATIFAWFLSAALGAATEASRNDWWLVASAAIGLAASLVILMAYVPPAWVRRRYGVASVDEPGPA